MWFAGAHSNVGGGYPKQGMSLVALEWMMQKAKEAGLRFIAGDRILYGDHANVDDKLYDPRSTLGMFYRWKPRDIDAMCQENAVAPAVHVSVLERVAHGTDDYNPGNLPARAQVVITPTGDPAKDATASTRAAAMQAVLHSAHAGAPSLLSLVQNEVILGRVSYHLFLLSCIALVLAAAAPNGWQSVIHLGPFLENIGRLLWGLVTSLPTTLQGAYANLVGNRALLSALALAFLAAYVLGRIADRGMSKVFSEFWHDQQQRLRDALKRAREASAGGPGRVLRREPGRRSRRRPVRGGRRRAPAGALTPSRPAGGRRGVSPRGWPPRSHRALALQLGDFVDREIAALRQEVEHQRELAVAVPGPQRRHLPLQRVVKRRDPPRHGRPRADDDLAPVGRVLFAAHVAGPLQAVDHAGDRAGREPGGLRELAGGRAAAEEREVEALEIRARSARSVRSPPG